VIPRNVQFIHGSAFVKVNLSSISIEPGNERFVIETGFLIDVIHRKLIRNFATSSIIIIPSYIEILGSSCFGFCESLSSISFESSSQLKRIESLSFEGIKIEVVIPSTIRFVASDAFSDHSRVSLAGCDFCPEFHHWLILKMKHIAIDFRHILRFDSGFLDVMDYLFDISIFEEGSVLCDCGGVLSQLHQRLDDDCLCYRRENTR
jgi:hypothetical protein